MSSNNLIFYTYKRSYNSKLITVTAKFTNTKLDIVYLDNMSEKNLNMISSKSPTGTFPVLQLGEFFLSGTVAISKYLLSSNENVSNLLIGTESKRRALNDTWTDFTTFNVWPFYDEIIGQIIGNLEAHEGLFKTAVGDLMQVLTKVNTHLTFRTFLVDHHVSFADLVLAAALYPYFTLVLDEKMRQSVPNVERWFLFVANLKELTTVLGRPRLCKVTSKPSVTTLPKLTPIVQTKTVEKKPVEQKKIVTKKPEPKQENSPQEVEVKEAKQQNPMDALPPTTLDFDGFKKDFLNTKQKRESLDRFWNNYDANGWSIWHLYYNKSSDQGKIKFMTCNLKSNFLQKLEKFRKYTFSVHGVYGVEPNLEVQGVWMWRGLDIPLELKEHDSYEYITFKKLDPVKDRSLIEEYWLNVEEGEIVQGLPVVDAEYFK